MPITLTAFDENPLCTGYIWEIHDEGSLASLLAELVLGEHIHAAEILSGIGGESPKRRDEVIQQSITEITKSPSTDAERYHRDGWLFQLMSWIAARKIAPPSSLIRAPHQIKTQKGFDGLIIEIAPDGSSSAVICEDKATENPRHTITSRVWPEFKSIEARERDRELSSEVSTLLLQLDPSVRKSVAEKVLWRERKHYRVAITAEATHSDRDSRRALFEGFDVYVAGDPLKCRRAEMIVMPELRTWMDHVCILIAHALEELRTQARV